MNKTLTILGAISISLMSTGSFAEPKFLTTHNKTSVESNAYIDGTIRSPHPTKANSDGNVMWPMVRLACFGHTTNDICTALIKMETNTNHPVDLGTVSMNLNTGDISPKFLSNNGYTMQVIGVAEVNLTENK